MRKILGLTIIASTLVTQVWAQTGFNRTFNFGNVNPLINTGLVSTTNGGVVSATNLYARNASITTLIASQTIIGQAIASNTAAALNVKQNNQASALNSGLTIEASNSGNQANFFMDSSARLRITRGSANSQLVFGSTNSAGVFGINLTGAVTGSSDNPSSTLHVSGTTRITSWTTVAANTSATTPLDVYGKISATSIQVNAVATCGAADTGVIRFNSVSNTIQFCNGVKFVSLISGT